MKVQELIESWRLEEQQPFRGWDFTHLRGRITEPSPSWSYEEMVRGLLPGALSVLDIGTGGGEKLLEFSHLLPARTYATEGWRPNITLAGENLAQHGIEVVPYNAEEESRMPFAAGSFALVINRHEAFDGAEIARILAPRGVFLTQQADGPDLATVFDFQPHNPQVTLSTCASDLQRSGLVIEYKGESTGKMRFADVGALVYFAHAAPWEFPADFSVDGYAAQLLQLHRAGNLTFDMRHFMIKARKPA